MRIEYFAWVREKLGKQSENITLPEGVNTIADLLGHLASQNQHYAALFTDTTGLRAAQNDTLAPLDTPISNTDTIAIFPPMTGG